MLGDSLGMGTVTVRGICIYELQYASRAELHVILSGGYQCAHIPRTLLSKSSDWELNFFVHCSVRMYPSEIDVYGDNIDCSTWYHVTSIGIVER